MRRANTGKIITAVSNCFTTKTKKGRVVRGLFHSYSLVFKY